jgi:chromosome segregation ATPase
MSDVTFLAAALRVKIEDLCFGKENIPAQSSPRRKTDDTERLKQETVNARLMLEKAASELTLSANIGRKEDDTQTILKLESQAKKIFTLTQELHEKVGIISSLQRELKESTAASEKITRESERKDDFLNAIHADIDSLKGVLQTVKESFKQTRAELLASKTVQFEHIQVVKQQAADLAHRERGLAELQRVVEEKDAKLMMQLAQLGRSESLVSSLRMELEDSRQSAGRWSTQAEEAQALVLELHTRVYEMQSKYASTEALVADMSKGMQSVSAEHQKMTDM